jgi:peroxiredoxin
MAMRRRVLVLPISAVVIAALCAYKLSRSDEPADPNRPLVITRRAPLFELYNQRKPPQLTWLKSFLGRHWIVLVFFDEETGLAGDPNLVWLREHAAALRNENVKVFVISTALPQTHRKLLEELLDEEEPVPFQLLTDLDGSAHQQYGLYDPIKQQYSTGVFLIDRAGNLPWNREHPLPLESPSADLARQFSIE